MNLPPDVGPVTAVVSQKKMFNFLFKLKTGGEGVWPLKRLRNG